MTTLTTKTLARLTYETNALMTKMVRTRQMRLDGKTSTPAYAKALESIRKTKALCHKLRNSLVARDERAHQRADARAMKQYDIADKVIAHAKANYEKGWDWVIECTDRDELRCEIDENGITSFRGALKHFGEIGKTRCDLQADISAA
jgi:hypothetical protein